MQDMSKNSLTCLPHRRHGRSFHLDRPLPLQLPGASGDDAGSQQDRGRGAAVTDWRVAGQPGAGGLGLQDSGFAVEHGAGNRKYA